MVYPDRVKNILCVRNDRFGEFLLNLPALRALKQTFVNSRIIAVIHPYLKELTQCIPLIDDSIQWAKNKHSLTEKIELIKLLRSKEIDIAVMLNPSKEFNIFTYLSGIPIRAGYARKWDFLLTHKIEDKKYLGDKHEVEYNLELVNIIGAATENKTISLNIDSGIILTLLLEAGIKTNDCVVALHPWTSDPIKEWPLHNYRQLLDKLLNIKDIKVVIIGGKEELKKSRCYDGPAGKNVVDLTGKTSLIELAALLKRSKLLISGDSGPIHLACAVGTQVLAIFRSDIQGKTAQRWGPWGKGHIVIEKSNLCDITVDDVFDKIRGALNK